MPLPLILGILGAGLGVGTAAVAKHCADEVIDDYVTELNVINYEMESIQEKTNALIEKNMKKFERAYDKLSAQREQIVKGTLEEFADTMSKFKNIDIELSSEENRKLEEFRIANVSYKNNAYERNFVKDFFSNAIFAGLFGIVAGGAVSWLVKGVQLQGKIEEAKVELARVKAASEEAKVKCTKLASLTTLGKNIYKTIDTLKCLTEKSIDEVKQIIDMSGKDYSKYTDDEKNRVMIMYNFSFALMDLVFTDIFDEDGEVTEQFRKYVDYAKNLNLVEEKDGYR